MDTDKSRDSRFRTGHGRFQAYLCALCTSALDLHLPTTVSPLPFSIFHLSHPWRDNHGVTPDERTRWVAEQARALDFDLCGVAPAEGLEELARLPEWLARGYAGEMRYLHDPRRADPSRVVEGARSLIVCALDYNTPLPYSTEVPAANPENENRNSILDTRTIETRHCISGWISRYAWGDDYHEILGEKLNALVAAMHAHFREPFEARAYVDTGPVVERVAAKYAGLGWLAKNTCLINEQLGSWLFLGMIVTTLEFAPSLSPAEAPSPDLCGHCTQCIDACPTGAIVEPYVLDARRCISYLTIELRGSIPAALRAPMGRHAFGCDICQDVCPWNRNAPPTSERRFEPRVTGQNVGALLAAPKSETRSGSESTPVEAGLAPPSSEGDTLFAPSLEFLASLTEEDFRQVFRGSAIKRAKWRGLVRNACIALGNAAQAFLPVAARLRRTALLQRLAQSPDAVIAEHAQWALQRLRQ